jgi:aspartate kinase
VTGVTASGRVTWIRAIRGDIEDQRRRMEVELAMFERIAEAGISIDQVTINQAGVMFVVQGDRGAEIRRLLGDLNLAVRVREGCSKLSVVGAGMRGTPGVVHRVVTALSDANVEIIHATDSNITVSILVPSADAQRAEQAVHDEFHLEERSGVKEPA